MGLWPMVPLKSECNWPITRPPITTSFQQFLFNFFFLFKKKLYIYFKIFIPLCNIKIFEFSLLYFPPKKKKRNKTTLSESEWVRLREREREREVEVEGLQSIILLLSSKSSWNFVSLFLFVLKFKSLCCVN